MLARMQLISNIKLYFTHPPPPLFKSETAWAVATLQLLYARPQLISSDTLVQCIIISQVLTTPAVAFPWKLARGQPLASVFRAPTHASQLKCRAIESAVWLLVFA